METTEKMLTRQVSSVVRLHVAACGVPPRWRVGRLLELQLIQPRTVAVPSGCSSPRKGGDHGSTTSGDVVTAGGDTRLPSATAATKGHTRRCGIGRQPSWRPPPPSMQRDATSTRSMATNNCADPLLCPRVRMVSFPQTAYNFVGTVVGEVCSSLSPAGTHCLAPQLSVSDHHEHISVGLRRDCLQVDVPLRPSHSDGLHGIQVVVHMQLRHADGAYRRGVTLKSLSLFGCV
jgi:hypothetical protein